MKKIAILKWNSDNIDFNDESGYELKELKSILNKNPAYSAELIGFNNADRVLTETNLDSYDYIFVVNGPIISEDDDITETQAMLISALNESSSKKYFIFTDTALVPSLPKRYSLEGQWTILTQCQNILRAKELLNKYLDVFQVCYVPFEKMDAIYRRRTISYQKEYDFCYGDSNRNGARRAALTNFYGGLVKSNVVFCGSISDYDFDIDYVDYIEIEKREYCTKFKFLENKNSDDYNELMNKSYATIALFDQYHIDLCCITKRIMECVLNNTVAFYDSSFGKNIFGFKILDEFLQVSNAEEVEQKLQMIKEDCYLREMILQLQRQNYMINYEEFISYFTNILEN